MVFQIQREWWEKKVVILQVREMKGQKEQKTKVFQMMGQRKKWEVLHSSS
jgi:hypothetical protein